MHIARFAQPDLLRAVGAPSCMITKWDYLCDCKSVRIIKYINGSLAWRQIGSIGDNLGELYLGIVPDADFVGNKATMNSTSGVFLALYAPTAPFLLGPRARNRLPSPTARSGLG